MIRTTVAIYAAALGFALLFSASLSQAHGTSQKTTTETTPAVSSNSSGVVYKLSGLHCGGCVGTLQKALCEGAEYQSCQVTMTDEAKQSGLIRITPKAGQTVDYAKLKTRTKEAGYSLE